MEKEKLIILFSKRRRTQYLSHRRFLMFSGGKKSRFETLTKESETKPYKFMRERERERERDLWDQGSREKWEPKVGWYRSRKWQSFWAISWWKSWSWRALKRRSSSSVCRIPWCFLMSLPSLSLSLFKFLNFEFCFSFSFNNLKGTRLCLYKIWIFVYWFISFLSPHLLILHS